jgi:hypothetical protein
MSRSQRHGPNDGSERAVLNGFLSRLTYANVVATVAVFLALGGGAYALSGIPDGGGVFHGCVASSGALRVVIKASSCLKARTVKRGSRRVRVPGESAIAWNQQGQRGISGIQGQPGISGQNGADGHNGSAAASALVGRINGVPACGSGTSCDAIGAPSGLSTAILASSSSSESLLSVTPNAPTTARDLVVLLSTAPAGTNSVTVFIQLGINFPTFGCTVNAGSRTCNSGAATFPIEASASLRLLVRTNRPAATNEPIRDVAFAYRLVGA